MCGGWRSRGYAPSLWKAARISADVAERFSPSVARPDITVSVTEGCRCVVHPELFGENRNGVVKKAIFGLPNFASVSDR